MSTTERYEICVEGRVRSDWWYPFEGLIVRHEENGLTVLSGTQLDQSALPALLGRILDLNLKLVAVKRVSPEDSSYTVEER